MKKILKVIGNIFVVISIIFIIKKISTYNIGYSILLDSKNILIFIVCCLVYALLIMASSIPWKNIVQILVDKKIDFIDAAKVETKSNLMKYMPGNVFQYVGKNELAVIYDISHVYVASATVIDILINLISVFIIIVCFYFSGLMDVISYYGIKMFYLIIIGIVIVVVLAVLIIIFRKKIKNYLKTYTNLFKTKGVLTILKNILFHFIRNLWNAGLFILVYTNIVNGSLTIGVFPITGAFVLSWFVGFIMIGAPGGIGVREAVLTFLLANTMNEEKILLAIIIYRFVTTIGDVCGFLFSLMLEKIIEKIKVKERNKNE